jgi:hypothetical protein
MKTSCDSLFCGYHLHVFLADLSQVEWNQDSSGELGIARVVDAENRVEIGLSNRLNEQSIKAVLPHELAEIWLIISGCTYTSTNGNKREQFFKMDHLEFSSMMQDTMGSYLDCISKLFGKGKK